MSTIISQILQDNQALIAYGPLGVICAWFMLRAEKGFAESRSLAHRIDGLTKALLVDMVERESCGYATKKFAREEIAKIDARLPRV